MSFAQRIFDTEERIKVDEIFFASIFYQPV